MSKSHATLRFLRKVHLYIGIFTTPALLFFAITGALQTFSLHETTQGSSYKPPAWIASLAQLHKKQTTVVPIRKARPNGSEHGPENGPVDSPKASGSTLSESVPLASVQSGPTKSGKGAEQPAVPKKSHLPMKIFFLLVSVGLLLSTLTGVYMAYKYSRGWLLMTGLLVAGIVVPLLLLPY
jgi:hypothetical protein